MFDYVRHGSVPFLRLGLWRPSFPLVMYFDSEVLVSGSVSDFEIGHLHSELFHFLAMGASADLFANRRDGLVLQDWSPRLLLVLVPGLVARVINAAFRVLAFAHRSHYLLPGFNRPPPYVKSHLHSRRLASSGRCNLSAAAYVVAMLAFEFYDDHLHHLNLLT